MICDVFDLALELKAIAGRSFLQIDVSSDLPVGTRVILSCDRSFINKRGERCVWVGHNEAIELQSASKPERSGFRVSIDIQASDERAADRFRSIERSENAQINSRVSDELTVSCTVGGRQRLREFGKLNQRLTGRMVAESGPVKVVAVSRSVNLPMSEHLQPMADIDAT